MSEPFGKYQLLKRIAGGGMGEVFLARQAGIQGFEKLLVIKTLLPHLGQDPQFVEMFLDEARLAARLSHPNLISIFDLGEVEGIFYIAMDYVHGEDLKRMWKQAYREGVTIPPAIAARIVADAAAGLGYAHRLTDDQGESLGLVHRDVSPQNILLTFDGGVKLIDFGVAKAAGRATHTQTGALKGKYAYMSPEQVDGAVLDQRSDVFALGIVLWEMVTGSRLFRADTEVQTLKLVMACEVPAPSEQNPHVPAALDPILLRALAHDRDQRTPDMETLRLELEEWLSASQAQGSSAHLAGFMRRLFHERLAAEGTRGALADIDPSATGFSPLTSGSGARRLPAAREPSDTSARSLVDSARRRGPALPLLLGGLAAGIAIAGVTWALAHRATVPAIIETPPPPLTAKVLPPVADPTPIVRPTPPPAPAQLMLRSEPSGATVFLEDRQVGVTPGTWSAEPHPVTLTFRLKGFRPASVAVTPGKDSEAVAHLVRERSVHKGSDVPAIKMSR
jgi:hypothetical protein